MQFVLIVESTGQFFGQHTLAQLFICCFEWSKLEFLSVNLLLIFYSVSPFASSADDKADVILTRIGSGLLMTTGGNWELVSDGVKVRKEYLSLWMETHITVLVSSQYKVLLSSFFTLDRTLWLKWFTWILISVWLLHRYHFIITWPQSIEVALCYLLK